MDQHPPNDRLITSGAVAAAWAMVGGLFAATVLVAAFAPARPTRIPITEQAALHSHGCTSDDATGDDPEPALRD